MAGIQIASLFASIGADTSGLEKGLKSSKGSLQGLNKSLGSMITTAGMAAASIAGIGISLKKVYDFAKEGADLEFARSKFDNLSKSIGTTSTLLMTDLREATSGMISDAELVASAGNIMSLGLAQTHDEVIRLTNVAGALGMDMNQLVLTLTNKTTMRFDALGVSVDGFEEKVKSLEKTGMSANEAFSEAFLQQAEEQIARVGSKADSTAGDIARLETSFENLSDSAKIALSGALYPAIKETSDLFTVWADRTTKNTAFKILAEQLDDAGVSVQSFQERFADTKNFAGWIEDTDEYNQIINEMVNLLSAGKTGTDDWANSNYDFGHSIGSVASQINSVNLSAAREEYAQTASVLIEDLAGAYDAVRSAEQGWRAGIAGKIKSEIYKEFEDGKISADNLTLALEELDQFAGTQFAYEFKIEESIPDLTKALLEDPEGFISKMSGFESAMMPLDQSVATAMEKVDELQLKLIGMERNYRATVSVYVNQSGNAVGTGSVFDKNYFGDIFDMGPAPFSTGMASGGHVSDGMPYIVGERGPELFVPNSSGEIVPNNALNGGGELLGDILTELRNQPARMKIAIKEAMALVGG